MSKHFTLIVAVLLSAGTAVYAQQVPKLTFNWAHSVDGATKSGEDVMEMAKASDGDYFIASQFGTNADSRNVNFDSSQLADALNSPVTGGYTIASRVNPNLLLQKVTPGGDVKWNIYTRRGNINEAYSCVTPTSDGGAILTLKTAAYVAEGGLENLIEIVDATGQATTVKYMKTQKNEYHSLVMKLTADGKLDWVRRISGLVLQKGDTYLPGGKQTIKTATTDNFSVYDVAVDENDNIFIAGNYRTALSLKKADGTTVTMNAHRSVEWNGGTQNMGDLFLLKLDKNGYFVDSLLQTGTATLAYFDNMEYSGGKLYLNGRVTSDGTPLMLKDKTVDASQEKQTMVIAAVNAEDLSVDYVNTLLPVPNSAGKFTLQNKNLQLVDGSIYLTGLLTGGLKRQGEEDAITDSKSTSLKGYVAKVDPATGTVVSAASDTLSGGISGYFGVFPTKENLWLFGYIFGAGTTLTHLDKTTFEIGRDSIICDYGIVAKCAAPIVDGSNLVMMNRGGIANDKNSTATFAATDKTFNGLFCWGVVYYSYKVEDPETTGIIDIPASAHSQGSDIYTTTGQLVRKGAAEGDGSKGLAKGLYIIGGKKTVVE